MTPGLSKIKLSLFDYVTRLVSLLVIILIFHFTH